MLWLLTGLLTGGRATAQTLTVQNLAPFARREIAAVVVPFAEGKVAAVPALHVPDQPTAWQPFGARWADGSLRQALCLFAIQLPALGEAKVTLVEGAGPDAPADEIAMPAAELSVQARIGGKTTALVPPVVDVLENNALRRVELRRARLPGTGLVAELIVAQGRGDAHAYVDVAVFFADPDSPQMECRLDELAVESRGMALLMRHAGALGVQQAVTATGSRVVLLGQNVLGDGQGLRRSGALVPPLHGDGGIADDSAKAAAVCPLLGATDWSGTGAFGAYGEPAPLPPWLQQGRLRAVLAERHRAFTRADKPGGDPFTALPWGLAKGAGQTGDQFDFGVVKLSAVAVSGLPSLLLEVEASVLQEGCRPVHYFATDGSPLIAADRPAWVVWSGRTHWHGEVSKDRLGKPVPEPPYEAHGWSGKDREHWSSNCIGAFALLTGAHWARRELMNETQLYLAGQTLDRSLSTSSGGAPRGVGRTELAACWMYIATGDPDLLHRMNDRLDQILVPEWAGRSLGEDRVRPMAVADPDARMLQGKVRYWTPWQDAIAATGLGAVHRLIGNKNARLLAEELALNAVRYGWRLDDKECIVATAIRWQEGVPLTAEQLSGNDPTAVLWSYGTGFNEWAIGAVEIARVAALARGDAPLAARATTIQQRVRATRRPPDDGFYDRLSEWDAVHWVAAPSEK